MRPRLRITKTICQHSEELPPETVEFLRGIATDYAKVKTAVYERYAGIKNLNRLTPAYTVQNEMRACGLRQQLNLPVVYYEMAVAEAVTNIKVMWQNIKERVREVIRDKENLTPAERKYLRTILKIDDFLAAVLNRRKYDEPKNMADLTVNTSRLNNLLCRLVRRFLTRPQVRQASYFKVTPAGYRYQKGGICLVSRQVRRRVFVPLRDNQTSSRQISVKLVENRVVLHLPVEVEIRPIEDCKGTVCVYVGYKDALTLSNGNVYGEGLDCLVSPETERLDCKNRERGKAYRQYKENIAAGNKSKAQLIAANNLGKQKYASQKRRVRERTANFINAAINHMLELEKPSRIVVTKLFSKIQAKSYNSYFNRLSARSFSGYIRQRLAEKCRQRGIEFITVSSKDTRGICSNCGAMGECKGQEFRCSSCGYSATAALNSAKNIENKALGKIFD